MKNKRLIFMIVAILATITSIILISFVFLKVTKEIKILTERDSFASTYFKDNEVEFIADSEKENYKKELTGKTQFEYNINDDKIEIVKYKGSARDVIIPEKIDEYTVNSISLDSFRRIDKIFIPSTIENISGNFNSFFDYNYVYTMVVIGISILLYSIVILTLSNKNLEENFYNSTTYIFSIIYLFVSLGIACFVRINFLMLKLPYIIYGILTVTYILLMILLRFYKDKLLNDKIN